MEIKAGILAIGNEVVEGQITNRNASWLATELDKINITTLYHMACVDSAEDIKRSLNFLSKYCNFIIISGGLGPTIDDLTRQSLCLWLDRKLDLYENEWLEIQKKLNARELTIRDGHKNQARFPEGSLPLANSKGVAPGFFIKNGDSFIAALPGPPNEMQSMFQESLMPIIEKEFEPSRDTKIYKWICLGLAESEVAHTTESILSSLENVEYGYRLHKPYVEAKVKTSKILDENQKKLFQRLEEKLQPWLVGHSIEMIRENFHKSIAGFNGVYVIDHLTNGLLLEKLNENYQSDHIRYQCFERNIKKFFTVDEVKHIYQHMGPQKDQLFICLFPMSENSAVIFFNDKHKIVTIPRNFPVRSSIGQLYAIEYLFLSTPIFLKDSSS